MASSATKFMCLLIIMGLAVPSLATDYYVGDSAGWCPVANLVDWLVGKVFRVHDCLHFNTPPSLPPVPLYQVTYDAYLSCEVSGALFVDTSGNCAYTLSAPGIYYFIADKINCQAGVRICVTALAI